MRGVPRWLAVSAVVAIAAGMCAFTVHRALAPAALSLQLSESTLAADGFSSTELKIQAANGRELRDLQVKVEDPHRASLESVRVQRDSAAVSLRAGVLPGETKLRVTADGFAPQEIALQTTLDAGDTVGDGTPDFPPSTRSCRPLGLPPLVHAVGRIAVLPRTSAAPGNRRLRCALALRLPRGVARTRRCMGAGDGASRSSFGERHPPVSVSVHAAWGVALSRARRRLPGERSWRRRFRAVRGRGNPVAAQQLLRGTRLESRPAG